MTPLRLLQALSAAVAAAIATFFYMHHLQVFGALLTLSALLWAYGAYRE